MADYYPLISRAVAGLKEGAGESRRALYERARTALIAQLRGIEPALSESEITRERLALEEAIRRVESEAAHRGSASAGLRSRPGNAEPPSPRNAGETPAARALQNDRPNFIRPRHSETVADTSVSPSRPPRPMSAEPPRAPAPQQRPGSPPRTAQRPQPAPPPPHARRGLRGVVADADELGHAAAEAGRAARKTYSEVPYPSPEFDRLEPTMMESELTPSAQGSYSGATRESGGRRAARAAPAERPRDMADPLRGGFLSAPFVKPAIAIGAVLLAIALGVMYWKPLTAMLSGPSRPAETSRPASSSSGKITDRVGQVSSSDQAAAVAQRVVLYDEDPAVPQGKQYTGTAVWRTESVQPTGNQPPDVAIRLDVEIPERKLKMTMSIRRGEPSSAVSHTVEIGFVLPPDFAGGSVSNVPGVLMKQTENARGIPLAGQSVKVTDNFFLIGLSGAEADKQRNIQLLKERPWFDIPMVYGNQRRAILAIEKGSPGDRAFADAFSVWQ